MEDQGHTLVQEASNIGWQRHADSTVFYIQSKQLGACGLKPPRFLETGENPSHNARLGLATPLAPPLACKRALLERQGNMKP